MVGNLLRCFEIANAEFLQPRNPGMGLPYDLGSFSNRGLVPGPGNNRPRFSV